MLVGLARCTLTSLRYHARAGSAPTASASARGTVTGREEDGRFAFVEIEVDADVALDPPPDGESGPRRSSRKAERDCFVGASLTVTPPYTVNGEER